MMIDLDAIEGFDCYAGNERKSEAEQAFFHEPLLMVMDEQHSGIEPRWHALGRTDAGRLLHLTFTLRQAGRRIRVISARDMHRKQRVIHGQTS